MRRFYVWGVIAWAIGWLFLPPTPDARPAVFWWMAAFGTVLIGLAAAFDTPTHRRWPLRTLIAVLALIVFGWWWFDLPAIGALFLAAGALVMIVAGQRARGGRLADGLIVTGSVALFQLLGHYLFIVYVGPRAHGCAIPSTILAGAFRLFGIDAAALDDGLHLLAVDRLYQIVPSLSNMGVYVFLVAGMGLIALAVTGKIRFRGLVGGGLIIAVYALVRYAAVALWDYHQGGMPTTFWNPEILAWTAAPLGLFLQRLALRTAPPVEPTEPVRTQSSRSFTLALAAIAVGVFAWMAYEAYHPAGVRKQGRMLIDELHSDWEWTEMPFDTLWYGQQSTYNFYLLAEFWGKHFQMERSFDSLTPERLANVDILVLKVPTQPYAPQEVKAVLDWVDKGGGLILIGEHTNVFGYATFLNPVAQHFGIRFIPDIVYEIKTGDLNLHTIPELLPHPVAATMPPHFLFGGPCSIWGDLSTRSIITGLQLKTLPADYTGRNFFPERTGHTGYRFGMFLLSLSARYGKGRIVTFPDSTLWSNFFMFIPGKPELALALADYVNRYDPFPYWRILTFIVAIGALGTGAIAAGRLGREGLIWTAAVAGLVFGGSARLFTAVNAANYPLPQPHSPFAQLNCEDEHSRFFLPELRLARESDKDFSTFYLWASRVGVVPRKWPALETALAQPGALIIIDPAKPFDAADLTAIREYVRGGRTLFVFDDPTNRQSTSAPLLAEFGLQFDLRPIAPPSGYPSTPVDDALWRNGGRVIGGEPLVTLPDGSAGCARVAFGAGQVIAYANSHTFERKTMGYTAMIPNPIQNTISRFEYRLMTYVGGPPIGSPQPVGSHRRRPDAVPLGD